MSPKRDSQPHEDTSPENRHEARSSPKERELRDTVRRDHYRENRDSGGIVESGLCLHKRRELSRKPCSPEDLTNRSSIGGRNQRREDEGGGHGQLGDWPQIQTPEERGNHDPA